MHPLHYPSIRRLRQKFDDYIFIGLNVRHPVGRNIYVFMLHFIYLFLDHCISHFSNKIDTI